MWNRKPSFHGKNRKNYLAATFPFDWLRKKLRSGQSRFGWAAAAGKGIRFTAYEPCPENGRLPILIRLFFAVFNPEFIRTAPNPKKNAKISLFAVVFKKNGIRLPDKS